MLGGVQRLAWRYSGLTIDQAGVLIPAAEALPQGVLERNSNELKEISGMGFGYFLIIWDFINWNCGKALSSGARSQIGSRIGGLWLRIAIR